MPTKLLLFLMLAILAFTQTFERYELEAHKSFKESLARPVLEDPHYEVPEGNLPTNYVPKFDPKEQSDD